jgi:hypothetical protein
MTKEQKSQAIREFFLAPKPFIDTRAIVIGTVLALVGLLSVVQGLHSFGGVLLGAGILGASCLPLGARVKDRQPTNEMAYFSIARYSGAKTRFEGRPPLEHVLEWRAEGFAGTGKRSAERLGLDETTRDPICVVGPLFDDTIAKDDPAKGFTNDDILRRWVGNGFLYSTYRISVFHFTADFLGAYQANYNLIRDISTDELTDEFFYDDVVAVRTQTESSNHPIKTGERLEQSKMFSLAVSSGDRISVILNDPKFKTTPELETLGGQAIANIRSMLRQHKMAPKTA